MQKRQSGSPPGPAIVAAAIIAVVAFGAYWRLLPNVDSAPPSPNWRPSSPVAGGPIQMGATGYDTSRILRPSPTAAGDRTSFSFKPAAANESNGSMPVIDASIKLRCLKNGSGASLRGKYTFQVYWRQTAKDQPVPKQLIVTFVKSVALSANASGVASVSSGAKTLLRMDRDTNVFSGGTTTLGQIVVPVSISKFREDIYRGTGTLESDTLSATYSGNPRKATSAEESFTFWDMKPDSAEKDAANIAASHERHQSLIAAMVGSDLGQDDRIRERTAMWFELIGQIQQSIPLTVKIQDSKGNELPHEIHFLGRSAYVMIPWGYADDQRHTTAFISYGPLNTQFKLATLPPPRTFTGKTEPAWSGLTAQACAAPTTTASAADPYSVHWLVTAPAPDGHLVLCQVAGSSSNPWEPLSNSAQIVAGGLLPRGAPCHLSTDLWYPSSTQKVYLRFTDWAPSRKSTTLYFGMDSSMAQLCGTNPPVVLRDMAIRPPGTKPKSYDLHLQWVPEPIQTLRGFGDMPGTLPGEIKILGFKPTQLNGAAISVTNGLKSMDGALAADFEQRRAEPLSLPVGTAESAPDRNNTKDSARPLAIDVVADIYTVVRTAVVEMDLKTRPVSLASPHREAVLVHWPGDR